MSDTQQRQCAGLHMEVARFLRQSGLPADCHLLFSRPCGGHQNLPLLCSPQTGNPVECFNPDILFVKNGLLKLILDIEDIAISPAQICGNFLASALSTHFVHDVLNNSSTAMDKEVMFIQILDASELQDGTATLCQFEAIEQLIQGIIPLRGSAVTEYRLYWLQGAAELRDNSARKTDLRDTILSILTPSDDEENLFDFDFDDEENQQPQQPQ